MDILLLSLMFLRQTCWLVSQIVGENYNYFDVGMALISFDVATFGENLSTSMLHKTVGHFYLVDIITR